MDDYTAEFFMVIAFLIGLLIGSFLVPKTLGFDYKTGQIDAINGEIYYELKVQEDGSTDWKYNPNLKEK